MLLDHFGFRYVFNVLLVTNLLIDQSMSRCPMMFLTRYLKFEYLIKYCTKDLIELITMMFLSSWTVACSLSFQIRLVISNFITLSLYHKLIFSEQTHFRSHESWSILLSEIMYISILHPLILQLLMVWLKMIRNWKRSGNFKPIMTFHVLKTLGCI